MDRRRSSILQKIGIRADKDGSDGTSYLDDEMEKVFAMPDRDKFQLFRIDSSHDSPVDPNAGNRYDGTDIQYRKKTYPHMRHPIKSLHNRSMKKHSPKSHKSGPENEEVGQERRKPSPAGTDSDSASLTSPPNTCDYQSPPDGSAPVSSNDNSHIDDPPLLDPVRTGDSHIEHEHTPSPDRRVQFEIAGQSDESPNLSPVSEHSTEMQPAAPPPPDRKSSRKKNKERKYSLQEEALWKKRPGSASVASILDKRKMSVPLEETLQEVVTDELVSHRFGLAKGKRRFSTKSISGAMVPGSRKDSEVNVLPLGILIKAKKTYDHSPHEVFVQLDELYGIGEEREWKETARWIKYEEDVEEGSDRWGRPHVASLSFHSLLNLRRCLETGVILLDLEEKDLPGVAYRVVEQMVVDELIGPDDRHVVMRALLLKHRHVQDHERFRFMRRNTASYTSLQSQLQAFNDSHPPTSSTTTSPPIVPIRTVSETVVPVIPQLNNINEDNKFRPKQSLSSHDFTSIPNTKFISPNNNNHVDVEKGIPHTDKKEEQTYFSSTEDLKRKEKESIFKRIPEGAEATTVLVGAVEFLEQPTIAFVRLAEGILLPSITEVSIPVRFLFILLGPKNADLDYHEIGRSISTLMSNKDFHNIAYKATERRDLLSAINEFLDCSIVLPPGDWERKALLPFRELKAKNEAIRRRQSRSADATEAQKLLLLGDEGEKRPGIDPLRRTRKPFGGLINDIKRRFPFYISDMTDGVNCQCIAASIFMYFAALSGAITFGGLMADKTDNLIGISETLLATCLSGIFFALMSGQPLIIIGTTGPLMLFDESLYNFCKSNGIEYLTMRVYIGIWILFIALLVAFIEGSVFVKIFTRFSEEIFSSLISLLYIFESVGKLFSVFDKNPLMTLQDYCSPPPSSITRTPVSSALVAGPPPDFNSSEADRNFTNLLTTYPPPLFNPLPETDHQPDTALFCTVLALGTFLIALYLRHFRNSTFLGRSARRALGDFGVPIAIIVMVGLDYIVPTYTEKLKVPEGLAPSSPPQVRGWIIPFSEGQRPIETWLMFAAIVPALLVYILVFMETHISELIIDKPERKLKKGSGFHLDIVLVCLCNLGCGMVGAPWMCAATVRSITHVSSVTVMSRTHAPGEKPHIIEVKEQRVSSLIVASLVGISVMMSPLLRLVPMAVLFGVFLYMGISSIDGVQFFERLKLFLMPVKHHSQQAYVRKVATSKMHLFTIIQVLCLGVLWVVKSSAISLAFPFFLILMLPVRAQLSRVFTPAELRALDSDKPDKEEDQDELDFYAEALLPG
uniref:Anion exchange protein n=1 Tax=Cacopsylla melanoneura TaxID=428564 RepID=A0A8D8SFV2_9HEMI